MKEIIEDANIIDLCADIGILSLYAHHHKKCNGTCVELNPEYVRVGKKLLPEATWINASIFDYKKCSSPLLQSTLLRLPYSQARHKNQKKDRSEPH